MGVVGLAALASGAAAAAQPTAPFTFCVQNRAGVTVNIAVRMPNQGNSVNPNTLIASRNGLMLGQDFCFQVPASNTGQWISLYADNIDRNGMGCNQDIRLDRPDRSWRLTGTTFNLACRSY